MYDLDIERSYPSPWSNSAWLPWLLMSLSLQKHTPKTKPHFKREYDFIIVGSGSAGSVVANRLSEVPFVDVLLLEVGKSPPLLTDIPSYFAANTSLDWAIETVPQRQMTNQRTVICHAGKSIGGTSIINSMLYVRGNAEDYNEWERDGNKGWSYKDVLPYFKKIETNFAYPADKGYHGSRGYMTVEKTRYNPWFSRAILEAGESLGYKNIDYNGRFQKSIVVASVNTRRGQRCSTAKAYLVPAENRKNLDIVENALVTKIIIKNKRAVGVEVEHNGGIHRVKARREVIVSAGAMNSPKLLMLSGIGPADHLESLGIDVILNSSVGNNFHNHAGSDLFYQANFPGPTLDDPNNILEYIFARKGVLSTYLMDMAFMNEGNTPSPQVDHQLMFTITNSPANLTLRSLLYIVKPKSRGTIRLKSTDPHDLPLVDPNYFADPDDVTGVIEAMKNCKRIYESKPFKSANLKPLYRRCQEFENDEDALFRCLVLSSSYLSSHFCCSVKMGPKSDPTSVVDDELRVRGIKGLRVVDGSIIPKIVSGNTQVPIMMIGEKASDMIKKEIFKRGA